MSTRKEDARLFALEDRALDELLAGIRRLRRRVALPALIVAATAAWIGAAAHLLGFWPIVSVGPDGSYYVSTASVALAAATCAFPVIVPGVGLYFLLRARFRRAWLRTHAEKGLPEPWLRESVRRFD